MVAAQADWLHTEAEIMIKDESRRDLALLYPLLRPLPGGLDPLVQKFTRHVTQQGLQAIGPLQGENVNDKKILNFLDKCNDFLYILYIR
jgi:cullin 2